jgi:uncharacterized protein
MIKKTFYYFLGLIIMPLGIVLMYRSNLGPPPLATLSVHMSTLLPITLGTASFILQTTIVLLVMAVNKKISSSLIFVAATLLGFGIDFWDLLVLSQFQVEGIAFQILTFGIGLFFLTFGQNFVRYSRFKATPLIEYMFLYQRWFKTDSVLLARFSVEFSILIISFGVALLGGLGLGAIKIGTVLVLVGLPTVMKLQDAWMHDIFDQKKLA